MEFKEAHTLFDDGFLDIREVLLHLISLSLLSLILSSRHPISISSISSPSITTPIPCSPSFSPPPLSLLSPSHIPLALSSNSYISPLSPTPSPPPQLLILYDGCVDTTSTTTTSSAFTSKLSDIRDFTSVQQLTSGATSLAHYHDFLRVRLERIVDDTEFKRVSQSLSRPIRELNSYRIHSLTLYRFYWSDVTCICLYMFINIK